jgi:hypothetical protein
VLVQITRTTPLRRTILQFSQILLTLALTFMTLHLDPTAIRTVEFLFVAEKRRILKPTQQLPTR